MQPFLGLIAVTPYGFAPRGWAFCSGQLMAIAQNQALFALLGTTYGGDGVTTFALPDLRGRAALSSGQGPVLGNYALGERDGVENVVLTEQTMPAHTHLVNASSSTATLSAVNGNLLADAAVSSTAPSGTTFAPYRQGNLGAPAAMAAIVAPAGQSQPHTNQQPYLALNFIIALTGIFPSRN
jgi:microcystin-dependent protein